MLSKRYDIVTIGSATRDTMFTDDTAQFLFTPADPTRQASLCFEYGAKIPIDRVTTTFGGGAVNSAVNAAVQGWRSAAVVAVGDDEIGAAVRANLRRRGVDDRWVVTAHGQATGFSFILTAGRAHEHVIFVHRGANEALTAHHPPFTKLAARWWYVSALPSRGWEKLLVAVLARPGQTFWNPGARQIALGATRLAPYLSQVTVLGLNRDEATELYLHGRPRPKTPPSVGQLLRGLQKLGPQYVVITSGNRGADAYDGKKIYHQKAVGGKRVVDTTGVGDAFHSTFVMALDASGGDVRRALALAAKNSGAVTTKIGAQNGLVKVV